LHENLNLLKNKALLAISRRSCTWLHGDFVQCSVNRPQHKGVGPLLQWTMVVGPGKN